MNVQVTVEGVRLPSSRDLTDNELAWVEFIRVASGDADPAPTSGRCRPSSWGFG